MWIFYTSQHLWMNFCFKKKVCKIIQVNTVQCDLHIRSLENTKMSEVLNEVILTLTLFTWGHLN